MGNRKLNKENTETEEKYRLKICVFSSVANKKHKGDKNLKSLWLVDILLRYSIETCAHCGT